MPDYSDLILKRMTTLDASKLADYQPFELCNLEYSEERLSSIDMHKDDTWIWGNRLIRLVTSAFFKFFTIGVIRFFMVEKGAAQKT